MRRFARSRRRRCEVWVVLRAKRQDLERALCRLDLNHPPTAVDGVDRWSLTGAQIRKSCTFILKQRIHVEVAALFTANAD